MLTIIARWPLGPLACGQNRIEDASLNLLAIYPCNCDAETRSDIASNISLHLFGAGPRINWDLDVPHCSPWFTMSMKHNTESGLKQSKISRYFTESLELPQSSSAAFKAVLAPYALKPDAPKPSSALPSPQIKVSSKLEGGSSSIKVPKNLRGTASNPIVIENEKDGPQITEISVKIMLNAVCVLTFDISTIAIFQKAQSAVWRYNASFYHQIRRQA